MRAGRAERCGNLRRAAWCPSFRYIRSVVYVNISSTAATTTTTTTIIIIIINMSISTENSRGDDLIMTMMMTCFIAPGAPTNLHVEPISSSSLRLTWSPPHDVISASGYRVNGYVISCSDSDFRQTVTATVTSPEVTWYTVGGLAAYTAYRVHVTVRSALGDGPSTPTTWARTLEAGTFQPSPSSAISTIIHRPFTLRSYRTHLSFCCHWHAVNTFILEIHRFQLEMPALILNSCRSTLAFCSTLAYEIKL